MSLRNTVLKLFCRYCLWCPYHWFLHRRFLRIPSSTTNLILYIYYDNNCFGI
jgi:hypothetical protein